MSKSLVNKNGQFMPAEQASVSIFDRGFLYGDSVYEVTLTYNKRPFLLEDHLDRLWRSAERISLPITLSKEEFKNIINEGVERLGIDRQYIRIIITRGEGEIGLDPNLAGKQNVYLIFKELKEYPKEWYEKGVHMIIADVLRNPKKAVDPDVKSGNYLNNVLAMIQAKKAKAFDAIMLNHNGHVTEATTSNIWIVEGDKVITPPVQAGLLQGITRKKLLTIGKKAQITMMESAFTADTLKRADEIFLTSSTKEIVPITQVDQTIIGNGRPGKMTKRLHALYKEFVSEQLRE